MAWFNADDKMHSHPKTRTAGLEAMGLWLVAGTYCTDYLTDGEVPTWFVESWPKGKALAQKLVKAGYWDTTEDGWVFRSWQEYQRSRDQVLREKAKAAERKKRWQDGQKKNAEPDMEVRAGEPPF